MVRYSDELIEEIRNNNDIVDIISQYVALKRSGRNFFGLCPFHKEKSPSFSVSPDKQIFHCFGCGVGGNVIHFVSKIENINFKETLELLAEKANITLPVVNNYQDNAKQLLKSKVYEIMNEAAKFYHENLYKNTSKIAKEYVKKRRLDEKTLQLFMIGFAGNFNELAMHLKQKGFTEEQILASSLVNKNNNGQYIDRFRKRLMFPIQDVRGKTIAFGGRILDNTLPKYINSPENIIYSKGRHLYGLNVAKKSESEKIIIVEGYMDAISLHQRGITNVVASLGTALTEQQGRLLRKYAKQVIIGYDSDGAGQAATLRGLEILDNMGCDLRILQMSGAKDPDEYVIKYGSGRFNLLVDKAISLVEFKVKVLKQKFNIENTNDKIKFLNEISKILSKVDNKMEQEIYIEKISQEYNISKEAMYAQINKIAYSNSKGAKILEQIPIKRVIHKKENTENERILIQKENLIIALLINKKMEAYNRIKETISLDDIKNETNKKIVKKLYEEFENGNSIISNLLDLFKDEDEIGKVTEIMADDYEFSESDKCIQDILKIYTKQKLIVYRDEIIKKLENTNLSKEEVNELENELSNIIIELTKTK